MSQENEEVTQTVDDDAAFEAGIAMARGDESPPVAEPVETVEAKTEEPEAKVEEPVAPEPAPIVFAGLTEEQLRAQLAKAGEVDDLKTQVRNIYGKLGTYQDRLNHLQQGSGRKLTPETFSRLKEAGYDDLAEKLAEDLSGVSLGGSAPPQQVDLTPIQREIQQIKEQHEMKLLTLRHRNWQQDVNGDDFRLWSQTLSAEDRQMLNSSWDAMALGDKLDEFKAWRERAAQAQTSQQQQKQQRLEAAVTPKGVPSVAKGAIDDEEAFMAGIRSVRGR